MGKRTSGRHLVRKSLQHHVLPIVVWIGAIACIVMLLQRRSGRFQMVGIAQGRVQGVAATCTGRLRTISVDVFDTVQAGQTIALLDRVLDDENIEAELVTAAAQIEHLISQLAPTQEAMISAATNAEVGRQDDRRNYSVDVEAAQVRVLELRVQIEVDRVRLEELVVDVRTTQELVDKDAVVPVLLEKVKAQYDALAKQIEERTALLREAEASYARAKERRDAHAETQLRHPSVDDALEVLRKGIRVQEKRVEELMARRRPVELKSPYTGTVSQIGHWPGEAVAANETILTVAEPTPSTIVAYVSEPAADRIGEGTPVQLIKTSADSPSTESKVISVGPMVEQMPQRLWRNPTVPQWGRPVLFEVPAGMSLISGELVRIHGL